jgi:F-type H+-transporting ATPase subunit b
MESGSLFEQLGINWQLLASQAVNFFILLVILRVFVYGPLLNTLKKRAARIKEGIDKANEADIRLKEVDNIAKAHLKKTDQEAAEIIKNTEKRAEVLRQSLQKKADDHHAHMMAQMEENHKRQQEEMKKMVLSQAADLVKRALIKTVQMDPKHIDDALIGKAAAEVSSEKA